MLLFLPFYYFPLWLAISKYQLLANILTERVKFLFSQFIWQAALVHYICFIHKQGAHERAVILTYKPCTIYHIVNMWTKTEWLVLSVFGRLSLVKKKFV